MKCHYHPDIDSARNCNICSRNLCPTCSHLVKGQVFCQDCLVSGAELAAVAHASPWAGHSPRRAALLALVPGLGAVYNQQYPKAVQHFGVFAGLVFIAGSIEILVLAVISWCVFTIFDAYRSAQELIRRSIVSPESIEMDDNLINKRSIPIWGGVLILMGLLFLTENLYPAFRLEVIFDRFWPLLLIAAGGYLIYDYYQQENEALPDDDQHARTAPNRHPLSSQAADPVQPPAAPSSEHS